MLPGTAGCRQQKSRVWTLESALFDPFGSSSMQDQSHNALCGWWWGNKFFALLTMLRKVLSILAEIYKQEGALFVDSRLKSSRAAVTLKSFWWRKSMRSTCQEQLSVPYIIPLPNAISSKPGGCGVDYPSLSCPEICSKECDEKILKAHASVSVVKFSNLQMWTALQQRFQAKRWLGFLKSLERVQESVQIQSWVMTHDYIKLIGG